MQELSSPIPTPESLLRCIIVDDEPIARRGMTLLASRHPALELAAVLPGASEAINWLAENESDLIFLDIEMPGMKGVDLAAHLPRHTMVVFTTAYSEYAVLSYDLDAIDYLLKPIDTVRFDRAVQKALRHAAALRPPTLSPTETITLRANRRFVNIPTDSILFAEGVKDYVRLHSDSGRIISRITIKALLEMLPLGRFARIHKSYVINLDRVTEFDASSVILRSRGDKPRDSELPVGAAFRANLLTLLAGKG